MSTAAADQRLDGAGGEGEVPFAFTAGAGTHNPRGKRIPVTSTTPVEALQDAVGALAPAVEAWWSPHLWTGDHRSTDAWEAACAIVLDIDYHDAGGKHAHVPDEPRLRFAEFWQGEKVGSLCHHTPRGERVIFVLEEPATDRAQYLAAADGAAAWMREKLEAADLLKPSGGFLVDHTYHDLARMLYTPRATVNGEPRRFGFLDAGPPFTLAALIQRAPPPPPPPARMRVDKIVARDGRMDLDSIREKINRWNDDHAEDWPRSGGDCPACGHHGCFGHHPENFARWVCFSTQHKVDSSACGIVSDKGLWTGDALDLEAHQRGRSRPDVLRSDGYLVDRACPEPGRSPGGPDDELPPWVPGPNDFGFSPGHEGPSRNGEGGEPGAEPAAKTFQIFDAADRADWPCKDIEWIVEPILAKDHIAYDHSSPKTFKTWRALDLAFSIAHGIPWLGKFTARQSRVLYCANEDRLRRFKVRLGEIETGHKLGPAPKAGLVLLPIRDQADPKNRLLNLTDLIDRGAIIRAGKGFDLIVFDMIAYMMGELDEDKKNGFSEFATILREIQDATDTAIYGVEHNRKGSSNPRQRGTDPDPQEMRGSGAKYGLVDLLVSAMRPTDDRRVIVRIENRDHDEIILLGIEIAPQNSGALKIRTFDLEAAAEMQKARGDANRAKVLEATTLSPSSLKEIARRADMPPTTASGHLKALVKADMVLSTSNDNDPNTHLRLRGDLFPGTMLYMLTKKGHETKEASRETGAKPPNDT